MTSIVNYQSNKVSGREVPIHQCNDPMKISKFLMDNKVINSKMDCKIRKRNDDRGNMKR